MVATARLKDDGQNKKIYMAIDLKTGSRDTYFRSAGSDVVVVVVENLGIIIFMKRTVPPSTMFGAFMFRSGKHQKWA